MTRKHTTKKRDLAHMARAITRPTGNKVKMPEFGKARPVEAKK